ncbi:hypothetical protein [Escherichia phage UPEC06]|nr:hypothetical protein [Escherichia phage UPEC06]
MLLVSVESSDWINNYVSLKDEALLTLRTYLY